MNRRIEGAGPPGNNPKEELTVAYRRYYQDLGQSQLFAEAMLLYELFAHFLSAKKILTPNVFAYLIEDLQDYILGMSEAEGRLREQADSDGWLRAWLLRHPEYLTTEQKLNHVWPEWLNFPEEDLFGPLFSNKNWLHISSPKTD